MSKVKLYVSECYANGAGNLKRMKTRAKGRHGLLSVLQLPPMCEPCRGGGSAGLSLTRVGCACRGNRILKPISHLVIKVTRARHVMCL